MHKKQFADTDIIGQENLLRKLADYTNKELSTASTVQSIYRDKTNRDLTGPGMLSVERLWPARNTTC